MIRFLHTIVGTSTPGSGEHWRQDRPMFLLTHRGLNRDLTQGLETFKTGIGDRINCQYFRKWGAFSVLFVTGGAEDKIN